MIVGDALARFFVRLGRARAQLVQSAMHVGVVVLVIMPERFEDGARLLRWWRRYRNKSADGHAPSDPGSGNPLEFDSNLSRRSCARINVTRREGCAN